MHGVGHHPCRSGVGDITCVAVCCENARSTEVTPTKKVGWQMPARAIYFLSQMATEANRELRTFARSAVKPWGFTGSNRQVLWFA